MDELRIEVVLEEYQCKRGKYFHDEKREREKYQVLYQENTVLLASRTRALRYVKWETYYKARDLVWSIEIVQTLGFLRKAPKIEDLDRIAGKIVSSKRDLTQNR